MKINTQQSVEALRMGIAIAEHEKADAVIEKMAQSFWPMIGTANQAAFFAMDDAIEEMGKAGMLRHQAKVKAMKAVSEFERYDKAVKKYFHDIGDDRYYLWADLVNRAAERLQPDVDKLYIAIKNCIDGKRVPNSVALAKIQTALALLSLSVLMYDTMAAQYQRQTMIKIAETFRGGRLTAVESNWKAVGYITGKMTMQHVNLRDDPQCNLGVRVILARYQSADFLNDAAEEALALNPEIESKYLNDKKD